MMHKKIVLMVASVLSSGCVSSAVYSNAKFRYNHPPLNPPKENRWLVIEGELPPEIKLQVVTSYVSSKGCLRNSGEQIADIYKLFYPEPGRYSLKVPLNGGTHCDWVLYEVDLSSEIKDPNYYNSRIHDVAQYSAMVSVSSTYKISVRPMHEKNGGPATEAISLLPRYYPYVRLNKVPNGYPANSTTSDVFLNRAEETSPSYRRTSSSSFYYLATPTSLGTIHFSPSIDHEYLVVASSEGSRLEDNFINRFHYPNGDITENEPLRDYRYYEIKPKKKAPWNPIIPD